MRRLLTLLSTGTLAIVLLSATFGASVVLAAAQPRLGTAGNYAVMAATAITNTGPTVVNGNLAISPSGSSSVTGFLPGVVTGQMDMANANAVLAQTDLVTAYNDAAAEPTTVNLTGTDLGGLTLTPGVYTFDSSAQLTGTLTLDGQGSTNAVFIFQMGSTLTTASASHVELINGAGGCAVFWQVGSSATLGTTTDFQGTIMAMTSITMTTGATIGVGGAGNGGRALARNAALTLDTNVVIPPPAGCVFAPAATATPVPTAVPTAVPTVAPTVAPTTAPTAGASGSPAATGAPSAPATAGATSPSPSSPVGAPVVTVAPSGPEFAATSLPFLPGLPDTSMLAQVAEQLNRIALPALIGAALLAGMFLVTLRKRRHA